MKFTRSLPIQPRRDAWVQINLAAIESNAKAIRNAIPKDQALMAIVKADAYGHGAVMVIPTLQAAGVQSVGVASMDEAFQIRESGLEIPILVLGDTPDWSVQLAAEKDITLTIFSPDHIETLEHIYNLTHKPVAVQIKVDTGMHRIGIPWSQAAQFIHHCQNSPALNVVGMFSHFASSNHPDENAHQLARWQSVLAQLDQMGHRPPMIHIANSSGIFHIPSPYSDQWHHYSNTVRIGIGYFGYSTPDVQEQIHLTPAMGLKARIVHIQDLDPGTGVSYDHQFIANRPTRIATLPLGYADGVPRRLSGKIFGLLHGQKAPQVGWITMDQLMIDITDIPNAQIGETITLLGQDGPHTITLTDWAHLAQTIEYELMCALRVRLPRTFTRD